MHSFSHRQTWGVGGRFLIRMDLDQIDLGCDVPFGPLSEQANQNLNKLLLWLQNQESVEEKKLSVNVSVREEQGGTDGEAHVF